MTIKPARERFTPEEVAAILRRNVELFKDEPSFASYFTELTMFLLDAHYGDGRISAEIPPAPPRPIQGSADVQDPSGIGLRVFLDDYDPPTAQFNAFGEDPPTGQFDALSEEPPVLAPFPEFPDPAPAPPLPAAQAMPPRPQMPSPLPVRQAPAVPVPPPTAPGVMRPGSGPQQIVAPRAVPPPRPAIPNVPAYPPTPLTSSQPPIAPPPPPTRPIYAPPGASQPAVPRPTPAQLGLPSGPSAAPPSGSLSQPGFPKPTPSQLGLPAGPPPGPLGGSRDGIMRPPHQTPPPAYPPAPPRPSGVPIPGAPGTTPRAVPPVAPPTAGPPQPRPVSVNSRSSGVFQLPNSLLLTPLGDALREPHRGREEPKPDPNADPQALGKKTQVYRVVRPYRSPTSLQTPCPVCGVMVPMDSALCPGCGHQVH